MTGLTAFEPLGILMTEPVLPSARVVEVSFAPPLSSQPVPSTLSVLIPGASVYQLLSFRARNG